ncbi:MAG TPA: MFS transporter [Dehalococcoidia bacterium]|nr:MFS transporter [Dehalococcoidia bacterium]
MTVPEESRVPLEAGDPSRVIVGAVAAPAAGRRLALAGSASLLGVAGVALVAFSMRTAVSGVPPILNRLGLSGAGQSLLTTIPVLCFGAGALAGPRLRGRFGEERAIFGLLLALLAGIVLRAIWPDPALFPGTVLAGLAVALLNVLLPSLVKRRFPQRAGALMAAYPTVMTLGSALAAAATVPVVDATPLRLHGALGIWALPVLLALAGWLPQLRVHGRERGSHAPRSSSPLWRVPLAWQLTFTMGLGSLVFYGELSWLPAIYRDRGLSDAQAGLLLSVLSLVGIVGNVAAPLLAVRLATQRRVVAAIVAVSAIGVLGVLWAPTASAFFWVALLGVGQGGSLSLSLLLIVLRAADSDVSARLSSMAQAGGYLIAALGPLVMGLLHTATGSWTLSLLTLLGFTLAIGPAGFAAARNLVIERDGRVHEGPAYAAATSRRGN